MSLTNIIVLLFYIVISLSVGLILMGVSFNYYLDSSSVYSLLDDFYNSPGIRLSVGTAGFLIVFANFCLLVGGILNIFQKKKVVFNNPEGKVSIALSAIEDVIKENLLEIGGITDLKTRIRVKGRYISIWSCVALSSDISVLETTSEIQIKIKDSIQNIVGADKVAKIEVHVSKIAKTNPKEKKGTAYSSY